MSLCSSGVAVATAPPVRDLLTRAAHTGLRWAAGLLRRGWATVQSLLARAGAPGLAALDVIQWCSNHLTAVADRIRSHRVVQATMEVGHYALAAAAPLSRMVVIHRLTMLLVPARWVRLVLEALVVPVFMALAAPTALLMPSGTLHRTSADAFRSAGGLKDTLLTSVIHRGQ